MAFGASFVGLLDGENGNAQIADVGSVQSAIDQVASNGGGVVVMDPSQTYTQPSTPWRLKRGVLMNCNGATVVGSGSDNSTDIFEIEAGAQLWHPQVNLYNGGSGYDSSNQYAGNVFVCDTAFGAESGRPEAAGFYFAQGTTIQNGLINAVGGGGTGLYLHAPQVATESAITHCRFEFDVGVPDVTIHDEGLAVPLHMDTTGAGSNPSGGNYINSVEISGRWRYPADTGILQTGADVGTFTQQVRNQIHAQMQMPDASIYSSGNYPSAWRIEDPTWSKENVFRGWVWDTNDWDANSEPIWDIRSTYNEASFQQCKDNIMFHYGGIESGIVNNQSAGNHRIKDITLQSVTTV